MYRILKSAGLGANVIIENTETKANIILGRISNEIYNMIKSAGYDPGGPYNIWNIEVNKDLAISIARLTMKMSKPIRDQSKKAKQEAIRKTNKEIDAMDVMLGLANYN